MAERSEPPISEALMALFAGAAPLFEKARASGLFRDRPINVTPASGAGAANGGAASSSSAGSSAGESSDAQKSALQEIIVAQAMKIVALEAEVARLKGAV